MKTAVIILLAIGASILYGILHDQVTARICVEYFTIGHPPIFNTADPTLLGLGWGIFATWWAGAILGVPLAIAARAGRWPKRDAASLIKPMAVLLSVMAACAVIAGFVGGALAERGLVVLLEPLASRVPREKHVPFLIDLWAHSASYLVGFLGGIALAVWIVIRRRQSAGVTAPAVP